MAKKLKRAVSAAATAAGAMEQITDKLGAMAANLSSQPTSKQVMESAQQIWLAGMGAFSKVQSEGRKVFDTLVEQGAELEKQTRTVTEATLETARDQVSKTLGAASGRFDKLEQVFEERVHKSLNRLGVLTSKDLEALSRQVAELSASVRALLAQEKRAGARPAPKKAPAAKKAAVRKPAAKKSTAKKPAPRRK